MNPWLLKFNTFDPAQVSLREALCTLGNGYFATRGAAEEAHADSINYPGTYLAGGYNRLMTEMAGHRLCNEDLVNLPNWLGLYFYCQDSEDTWLSAHIIDYQLELNMFQGVLTRTVHYRDSAGRETLIVSRRIVHMANPHLAAISYQIKPLNWSGNIILTAALDGAVTNSGVSRYRQLNNKHWAIINGKPVNHEAISLLAQTTQSHWQIALAARAQIFAEKERLHIKPEIQVSQQTIAQVFKLELKQDLTLTVEKIVALYSSRDAAISECQTEANRACLQASRFKMLLKTHRLAWKHLWQRRKLAITLPDTEAQAIYLHSFHLLQTLSLHSADLDVGAPARGLHGEAYRGHVFWDELFILPFFTSCWPSISRSLLLYRYRRLNAARRLAKQAGFSGAMFPWQSASNGEEVSQQWHLNPCANTWGPDYSAIQRHVNSAIAYNVWQYYQQTHDNEFLGLYGAEMLLDIARFWASITTYNTKTKRYEIRGVMGPDEYHEQYPGAKQPGINNNAYTNVMAAWVIERALQTLTLFTEKQVMALREKLNLTLKELAHWQHITQRMFIPFHGGVISQFEGYERLQEFAWHDYQTKYGNIERLDRILKSENDSPNNYQICKQADVVMLFYLLPITELQRLFQQLGYALTSATIANTITYYLQRTSHGSTLSKIVFASVLRDSEPKLARSFYSQALYSDLHDTQTGTTPEGIHLGMMAATVNYTQNT